MQDINQGNMYKPLHHNWQKHNHWDKQKNDNQQGSWFYVKVWHVDMLIIWKFASKNWLLQDKELRGKIEIEGECDCRLSWFANCNGKFPINVR